MYYNTIESGDRIRKMRKEHRLTQEQLADELGISREYLGKLETGKRGASIDILIQIAEIYQVSLDYLILGKVEKQGSTQKSRDEINLLLEKIKDLI